MLTKELVHSKVQEGVRLTQPFHCRVILFSLPRADDGLSGSNPPPNEGAKSRLRTCRSSGEAKLPADAICQHVLAVTLTIVYLFPYRAGYQKIGGRAKENFQTRSVERNSCQHVKVWAGLRVENDQWKQRLFALLRCFKGIPLVPSTVENVEDICTASGLAVVDEVLPGREALYTGSDVAGSLTRIRMLSEQPETFGDLVNYAVCSLQTRPFGPIEEDLIQISLRIL